MRGCQHPNCGLRINTVIHARGHVAYEHDYVRSIPPKPLRLCSACETGKHDGRRTEVGCVEHVTREGYVCGCPVCKQHPRDTTPRGRRSDSEGTIHVRF